MTPLPDEPIALKNRFSFRLGTTSYIIPADIIPNIEMLASRVDDIELVLFESDEQSNYPDHETIQTLTALAEAYDLSYTVHLPLDIQLGSTDEKERRESVQKCLRAVDRTGSLQPFAYIIHFNGQDLGPVPSPDLDQWISGLNRSITEFSAAGMPMQHLCIESLDYPYELIEPVVIEHGLSVCLDIGHILVHDHPFHAYLDRYLDRCRVIHLHGIRDGKDHRDISLINKDYLSLLFERLEANQRERVVTLELFSRTDLDVSLSIIEKYAK